MDVRGFVYGLVDYFPGPLKTVGRRVADRLFGIWDDISNVLRVAIPWWRDLVEAVSWFTARAVDAAAAAAFAIRWLRDVRLPGVIEVFRQSVVNWVSGLLNDLRRWVGDIRDWLLEQAKRLSNVVLDYAYALRDWIIARLREIWAPLSTVVDLVGMLLTDPKRFAQWAIGAIWSAFWTFADQHIDAIIERVWSRRNVYLPRLLARIEAIMDRVL